MSKLIDSLYICSSCKCEVNISEESFQDHLLHNHPKDQGITFNKSLGWAVPLPGPGHFELNYSKMLLSLGWHPLLSFIAHVLGFRSPKAQHVVRVGSNHHRSRQILGCLLESLSCEIMVPFVDFCKQINTCPSVQGYFEWLHKEVNDHMFIFLHQYCFTYLLAFHLFNESVRKNNLEFMLAARVELASLVFATKHPKYQEIHVRDMFNWVKYSPDIIDHLEKNITFSVSGLPNKAQGADFVQEEQNKLVKSFLPPGMPTANVWQNISRKADSLKHIKNVSLDSTDDYKFSQGKELRHDLVTTVMRREIRSHNVIVNPQESRAMLGMSGISLDNSLSDIKLIGSNNHDQFVQNVVNCGQYGGVKLTPVFVTVEEREKFESIDSQTNNEIVKRIGQIIDILPSDESMKHYEALLKKVKGKKKCILLDLYYEVSGVLDTQLQNVVVGDIDLDGSIEETVT